MRIPFSICAVTIALLGHSAQSIHAHEGPDPLAHWMMNARSVADGRLNARLGPAGQLAGDYEIVQDPRGDALYFSGALAGCVVADDFHDVQEFLPRDHLTVSAWVSIDTPQEWGGIVGCLQDNGGEEAGWLLGYNERTFLFGLATTGADDGDGVMTYLAGNTEYERGKLYHVVAVYDGELMELYVNGVLDASSEEQSGEVLYPAAAPLTIGRYQDANEFYPHHGRIREIAIYDLAARLAWVEHDFSHNAELAALPALVIAPEFDFIIEPYLQWGMQTGMTIMWQTSQSSTSIVHHGETSDCDQQVVVEGTSLIHEVRIDGLEPETQYFYHVESTNEHGDTITSEVRTFQTAVNEETPFAFAIISDTQGNPQVAGQLAGLAWNQRPSFLLHPGDLVETGTNDMHWTRHFFPSMHELISRVPLFPVLGNHEQNARNYYDYMSLPEPEYYYDFRYGNAHFFMVDSNRNVDPGSEQWQWLEQALSESDAVWKFACHHHPPYSSDENDYGDLWKTNRSTRGDERVRQLCELYDRYGVDIVWNGHIHSYERTWPIRMGQAVDEEGTIYMITGGGGGFLENAGPSRPGFQNNVRHGHHYCMCVINGRVLEFKAFDLDDRLFDTLRIEKRE